MKSATSTLLVLVVACGCVHATTASPIGKVIQLMTDLQSKIVAEGTEAQKVYAEFAEFCEDRSRELGFSIKTAEGQVMGLKAAIDKETAQSGSLDAKIEELTSGIATDDADLKAATEIRTKEASDFIMEEKELTEVIDTLERAINVLEKEMATGGASMLQLKDGANVVQALSALVQASAISGSDGSRLTALVQAAQQSEDDSADASLGAPAAAVYEGHSGDIISTLEGLLEKAQAQLDEARKKETAAMHNFDMMKQSLEDDIKFANKDLNEAKKGLSASGERKATAEGDLDVTTKDLAVDTQSLSDLHKDCLAKAQDYEAATTSRGEELAAIAKAKQVIQETTGGAEKLVYGLSQTSFVQLHRSELRSRTSQVRHTAVRLLRNLARQQHSSALAQLASRAAAAMRSSVADGEDPFAKVSGLISDMIAKLEDEAAAEATHKAYCDKELAEANEKKADKDATIEKLTTKIAQMASRSAKLKEQVSELQKALSELTAAQAEMDKLRQQEHGDYVKNKADSEQGLQGVKLALKVLRDYYGQASGGHAAAEGAGASIVGLLEVCESDISKSLAEMVASEESAAAAYESETKENTVEKTSKEQDVKYKSKEATSLDKSVSEITSDRATVQSELDAVLDTLKALNSECVAKAETYEDRKARREAEIAGLKQALSALDGEAVLLQQQTKRTLRGARPHRFTA